MPDRLNLLRNASFAEGRGRPRGWSFAPDGEAVAFEYAEVEGPGERFVKVVSDDAEASGFFWQRVGCSQDSWYRIEAVVGCDCAGADERSGGSLWVRPVIGGKAVDTPIRLVGVTHTEGRLTLRSFFLSPAGATSLEIRVGLWRARGWMTVHSVLLIPNIEPDTGSNALSLPPSPYAYPPPRKVRRVCICDDTGKDRPLAALLRARYGRSAVDHRKYTEVALDSLRADALIIAGERPPAGIRSLSALEGLATDRLVIISLGAFARLSREPLGLRVIEQADDPICAKVRWANFVTRGFSLDNIFPLASTAEDVRVFRQRHIRNGAGIKALCGKRGYVAVLLSVTDREATCDHPICLYKATDGGGVVVFDVDPVEVPSTSRGETNLAAFCLLNMLGADQASLGHYTVPVETEQAFQQLLVEFSRRFCAYRLTGRNRHDQIVELGSSEQTLGLPSVQRPMLLIRTGLRGDDMAGVYGTLAYLKQLVRPEPYENPYVRNLINRFRLAWVPLSAAWQPCHWDASIAADDPEKDGSFDRGSVAAVIDITDSWGNEFRVIHDKAGPAFKRSAELLPGLSASFSAERYFYQPLDSRGAVRGRDSDSWRMEEFIPQVVVDADVFDTEFHRAAAASGASLIRIEIPGSSGDFVCNSIRRTDLAATTLEHVIGLQYGLLAMNRCGTPIAYGDHAPLGPGEAIDLSAGEQLDATAMRAG